MKIKYTGTFLDWFLWNLFLVFLTVVTLGIALPYMIYWNQKYFFEHLETIKQKNE